MIVTIEADNDTYVDQAQPNTNFDGDGDLVLGVNAIGSDKFRTFIEWSNLTAVPAGADITGARVGLRVKSAGKVGTFPITIAGILNPAGFDATTLDWNTPPPVNPPPPVGADFTFDQEEIGSDYWVWIEDAIVLLPLIQDWHSGATPNHGFAFLLDDENPGEIQHIVYYDSESAFPPRLEITYYSAEEIPAVDPGDDLDTFPAIVHDRLDAQADLEAAHKVIWTVGGTDHDITKDIVDLGEFRTEMPYIFEPFNTGEAVISLHNGGRKYSPRNRDSILFGQHLNSTPVTVFSGLKINGADYLTEQWVGITDYFRRNSGRASGEIKMRSRLAALFNQRVTVTYAAEDPLDALFDLCLNKLDLDDSKVNVKSFYDSKTAFDGVLTVDCEYVDEWGDAIAEDLSRAASSTLYVDRRGRIACHHWDVFTIDGTERELRHDTNLTSLAVRERDDLIINRIIINYSSDLSLQYIDGRGQSVEDHGLREVEFNLACIDSENDAADVAQHILDLRGEPPLEATCGFTIETLRHDVADRVLITEPLEGLDQELFVIMQRYFSPAEAAGVLVCLASQS